MLPISLLSFCVVAQEISPRATEALAFNCYTCHGPDGHSAGSIPALAGKSPDEIIGKLREFRADVGPPTIMNRIAKGYSEEELQRIAEYIAKAGSGEDQP